MTGPGDATALARDVVRSLLRAGVRELVLAPGSRNAPLAFAAYDAAEAGLLRLHTRIDERTAGFLALGLGKGGSTAAVVTTSGTAVANLHPAVLEAAHAGAPLVVVTADRPARLRGTGANQTTDQVGVFGPLVPTVDVTETPVTWTVSSDRPVHLNVQLDDPLTPPDRWRPEPEEPVAVPEPAEPELIVLDIGPRTVVVAGDDSGPEARRLGVEAGWPVLAEPSSGSRTSDHALRCYRLLLDPATSELAASIQRVVVFGHPTLSRAVTRLLARTDVDILAVPTRGVWPRRPFRVDRELTGLLATDRSDDPWWVETWVAADRDVGGRLDELLAEETETTGRLTGYHVAGLVSAAMPPGGHLVVGASNPIRDLDLMATAYEVGSRRKVVSNRGLSGIDGTLSTAIGASLARTPGGRNLALVGDVTFLHDANGLVLGPDELRPDLTVVVANDDGGSIFATLEQGAPEYAHAYERLFGTPHGVDLAALCRATGTPHQRVETPAELAAALAAPAGGIEVVEAVVDRTRRRELDLAIRALRPVR